MIYSDSIYGKINIEEPVMIELIKSNPVQRLRKITQHGPSVYNKHYQKKILTRFEHSLGVFILLKKLSTSLEEQIAGLLHDVGHTVFSHTIDFLFPEENGEYDKKFQRRLIYNSEIPQIFKKHKINIKMILDDRNFPILEKPLPNLCADRIDYFLRDPFLSDNFNKKLITDNLKIINNRLIFIDKKTALYFSKQYLKMNDLFWARPFDEYLYFLMVDIIKLCLDKKFIKHEDLFLNEEKFMNKIENLDNSFMNKKLDLLRNLKINQVKVSKKKTGNSYFIRSKIRVIDPLTLINNKLKKLSSIDFKYKKIKEKFDKKIPYERWVGYEK